MSTFVTLKPEHKGRRMRAKFNGQEHDGTVVITNKKMYWLMFLKNGVKTQKLLQWDQREESVEWMELL